MNNTKKTKNHNYIVQGSILAAASIIVRMIGLLYRIPLTRIIGNKGNSYYSCAFETYSMILLISSYSLPMAISKIVSERNGMGEKKSTRRILTCGLIFGGTMGAVGALAAYFGADFFTGTILNTPEGAICLRVLAPCIFIVAVMGVIRGFFQGIGTTVPTAVSQIIEQIINAIVAIITAYYLYSYGAKIDAVLGTDTAAAAYGASGSTLGTTFGALAGLLFIGALLLVYLSSQKSQTVSERSAHVESYGKIFKVLILTILPVLLSTAIYNVNGIIDQGIFKSVLLDQLGKDKNYVDNIWGIYTGKYKLLCNVPIAIASAMAASTMPMLSKQKKQKEPRKNLRKKVDEVIRFTMIISIPCAVGLAVLAGPILRLLFNDTSEISVRMLQIGSSAVVFYGLSTLTNGVLQGINRLRLPVVHAAIALVLHVGVLYVLLVPLKLEGYAVVLAYIVFAVIMCVLNGLSIRKYLHYRQEYKRTFVIPLIASGVMGVLADLVYKVIFTAMGEGTAALLVGLAVAVLLSVPVYFAVLLGLHGLRERELNNFPKGYLLVRIARKLHFRL